MEEREVSWDVERALGQEGFRRLAQLATDYHRELRRAGVGRLLAAVLVIDWHRKHVYPTATTELMRYASDFYRRLSEDE